MSSPQTKALKRTVDNVNRIMQTTLRPQARACVQAGLVCKVPTAKSATKGAVAKAGAVQPPEPTDEEELAAACKVLDAIIAAAQQTKIDIKCGVIVV
jgi:hypothetical protein